MKAELLSPLNPFSHIFLPPSKPQPIQSTQASLSKLPAGAKTIGNYLLGKKIGEGTFGKVHLAMHLPTGQKVAIKIIDKANMRPKDFDRVQAEIAVLKRVRHRHILSLYEIIETQKSLLLVTEFLPNGELFRLILKEKRLPEEQACRYFQQIVEALEYLHRNSLAHRDLKPQNMLIDFDGQLKLIDFGLSASYLGKPTLKTFCGSPCYASPEMVQGKNSYNPLQTDLWSCGVVLFAMLCGHLPFCDTDTHTLFKKIMACNYKLPSHLSPQAQDMIQRLLVRTPQKRISLEQIKEHSWFNLVASSPAYGLDIGEQLSADDDIVEKVRAIGGAERVREEVLCNVKSKDTATYFILMKKLVKAGEIVPTYLSSDNFNPKLIIRNEDKLPHESDTESYNQPDSQHSIKAPQAPEAPVNDIEGPMAGNWVNSCYFSNEELKDIDQGELMLLAGGILDLFLPKANQKPDISQIKEIIAPEAHVFTKLALERREGQFYANNKAHAKQQLNLLPKQVRAINKHLRSSSKSGSRQLNSSMERKKIYSQCKQSQREKTEPSRPISRPMVVSDHIRQPQPLYDVLKMSKKSDIVLPNLPIRVEQLRNEAKAKYLNKRYKIFKSIIH